MYYLYTSKRFIWPNIGTNLLITMKFFRDVSFLYDVLWRNFFNKNQCKKVHVHGSNAW